MNNFVLELFSDNHTLFNEYTHFVSLNKFKGDIDHLKFKLENDYKNALLSGHYVLEKDTDTITVKNKTYTIDYFLFYPDDDMPDFANSYYLINGNTDSELIIYLINKYIYDGRDI